MKLWSSAEFGRYIYNKDYGKTDREYDGTRSRNLFPQIRYYIHTLVPDCKRVLDYGAGNGVLAELLGEEFEAIAYDPYDVGENELQESDVITAIEVLEHEINAENLWKQVAQYLNRGGVFITTTEFCDGKNIGDWFYANPRAGHDLIYSKTGLEYMAISYGLKPMFHSGNWHLFRKI
jgi:2-polyprenyl-3-methyl-5-hydroxy-6-metoxy-1,4-benzoquinol methylase